MIVVMQHDHDKYTKCITNSKFILLYIFPPPFKKKTKTFMPPCFRINHYPLIFLRNIALQYIWQKASVMSHIVHP